MQEPVSRDSQNDEKQSNDNESKSVNQNFENDTRDTTAENKTQLSKKRLLLTMVALYLVFFLIALVARTAPLTLWALSTN